MTESYIKVSEYQFRQALSGSNFGDISGRVFDSLEKAKSASEDQDGRLILKVVPIMRTRLETHYEDVSDD